MNVPSDLRCLLVIPAYRDAARLRPFFGELQSVLPETFTVQLVDDGSGDGEAARLVDLAREGEERRRNLIESARQSGRPVGRLGPAIAPPILLPTNQGKGAAVRTGWLERGKGYDMLAFTDADGSVSGEEIVRSYEYFCMSWRRLDGLLASRVMMLGRRVERDLFRHLCGRAFATAVSTMTGLPAYDTQCGLKFFKASLLNPLLPDLQSNRFAFDVELIVTLLQAGAFVEEFSVDWKHCRGSKVSVVREMLPMLWDVWQAVRRVRAGKKIAGRDGDWSGAFEAPIAVRHR